MVIPGDYPDKLDSDSLGEITTTFYVTSFVSKLLRHSFYFHRESRLDPFTDGRVSDIGHVPHDILSVCWHRKLERADKKRQNNLLKNTCELKDCDY